MDVVTGPLFDIRAVDVWVRSGLPGPPGPPGADSTVPGPPGPPGDPAAATVIVGAFGVLRTPDELPSSGIIPEDWDGPGRPPATIFVPTGDSMLYEPTRHIFVYTAVDWVDAGTMEGPPGERGERGERGEQGDIGPRGDTGPRGDPGAPGERGETGDKGERGDRGERGEQGEQGERGLQGLQGEQGIQGEQGERGDEGPPSFPDAEISIGTYGRSGGQWVQVLAITGGTIRGDVTVQGLTLLLDDVLIRGALSLDAEPTEPEHAATKAYVDAKEPPTVDLEPYLRKDGGQMSGPLISARGTSATNPGVGIGDNATGFYRSGTALLVAVGGEMYLQLLTSPQEIMAAKRLNMATQPIINVADATGPQDALNLRTAEARYLKPDDADTRYPTIDYVNARFLPLAGGSVGPLQLAFDPLVDSNATHKAYVDTRRAPTVMANPDGLQLQINPVGQWLPYWEGSYPIARGGNSRIRITLALNFDMGAGGLAVINLRCTTGNVERRAFCYKPATFATGATIDLIVDVTGTNPQLAVEAAYLDGGQPVSILGGDPNNPARSQITIADLGPI